jgi:ATP-dependent RNA helicase RhlE
MLLLYKQRFQFFAKPQPMTTFKDLNLTKQLAAAIDDLGFAAPTPIQEQAFPVIMSGRNVVGIAQTGTGKTMAYMLPLLHLLKYSKINIPRIIVLVPTRELVLQVVEHIEAFSKYQTVRVLGVYGGTNINTQKLAVNEGTDVVVGTPGRLYDLALSGALSLKSAKKLVIDEVDVMLDLGFRFQLKNIFDLMPEKRQNIMFSATMTTEVDALIQDVFIEPVKISIAVSGTRLENIEQRCYPVRNFYTKINLLSHLIQDPTEFSKVLVFVDSKKNADRLFDMLEETYGPEMAVIHSNKSQNYRIRSVQQFNDGVRRILIATDVMARGLDLNKITHVININTPAYPENYMHRIGRTGRAEEQGKSILFYTEKEVEFKSAIEDLMSYEIPVIEFPEEVEESNLLTPEERHGEGRRKNPNRNFKERTGPSGFHEKKAKNKKVNLGSKYHREKGKKYKKSKTRGDKTANLKRKKK